MYVVENLTVRSWFGVVLPRLLRRRRAAGRTCYVIDAGRAALAVARVMGSLVGVTVERLDYRLVDVRDERGLLARLRVGYEDTRHVQAEILKDPRTREFLDRRPPIRRLFMYVAKSIGVATFSLRSTLWRALFVIQVCVWKRREAGAPPSGTVLFLERRPWPTPIADYAAAHGVDVVWLPATVDLVSRLRPRVSPAILHGLRSIRYGWLSRRPGGLRQRRSSGAARQVAIPAPAAVPTASLAVEYSGHLNVDEPHLYSDLFFWQQSALPGRDVMVYFGLPGDPLDATKWAALSRHGIGAVVTHPGASAIPGFPVFRPGRRTFTTPTMAGMLAGHERRWLEDCVLEYARAKDYWGELFERTGTKVFVSWYHVDATHCVVADALEALGGVTALYQRSSDELAAPSITSTADVYFSFSSAAADVHRESNSSIPYHVVTGYLGDHRFESLRQRARPLRERLLAHGATRILAFFDENSADDARWHTGHAFQAANYEFLLEKVLAHEWLGLVVKPKMPVTLRRRLGPVAELLARAEATGRCHVFDHGSNPPAAAAVAADIAVHGHLCAGTAGMDAALAGVPTLLLDREGWHISPLYRLGVGRVVFTAWDDVWRALVDHWKRGDGAPGFGDWSPLLDELDPFRDGRAAERMGHYLHWLVDGLKSGLPRGTVLADAAERYCRQWGANTVTAIDGFSTTGEWLAGGEWRPASRFASTLPGAVR